MRTELAIAIGSLAVAIVAIIIYSFWPRATIAQAATGGAGIDTRTVMMIVVSVVVLAAALYVVLSKRYDDATQKWAFGAVGTVIGFWLKQG